MQGGGQPGGGWGAAGTGGAWGGGGGTNPFPAQGAAGSINPFDSHQNQGYEVQTSYTPNTEVYATEGVVPAVSGNGPPQQGSMQGQVPSMWQVPAAHQNNPPPNLAFTQSTVPSVVSGNIGSSGSRGPGGPTAPPAGGETSTQPLLKQPEAAQDASKYAYWNLRRYRPYFDIDTNEVLWRVGSSLIGVFRPNFMEATEEAPDMYGPFWVATTLVFVTAVAGNFASYIAWTLDNNRSPPPSPPSTPGGMPPPDSSSPSSAAEKALWYADMTKLSASAGLFYGYVFILGLVLWLVIKYIRGDIKLVNIYCIYGYSLSIFIPVSLACIVPFDWLHWTLIGIATALSGGFLLTNLRKAVISASSAKSFPFLVAVAALHIGLGLGLKLYFFNY